MTWSSANRSAFISFPPTFPPSSESCSASRTSSAIYRLNSIGESGHPCLAPLPIDPGSEYSPSILTLIFCPMYRFSINLLSLQSTPILLKIFTSFFQSTLYIKRLLVVHKAYVYFLIVFQASFIHHS